MAGNDGKFTTKIQKNNQMSAKVEKCALGMDLVGNLSTPMLESKVAIVLEIKSTKNEDKVSKIRSKDELDNRLNYKIHIFQF